MTCPILLLRCNACHGPQLQQGELDLRTLASMLRGGKSGPALVSGDPDSSLMIQRIETQACPPSESLLKFFVRRPSTAEVKTLRDWIAAGAPEGKVEPDVATTSNDPLVSPNDRAPGHSSHQVGQTLEIQLMISWAEVDRSGAHLVDAGRSAHPDSTCLPRSFGHATELDELERWASSKDPNWYSRMIDHVLSSPLWRTLGKILA